MDLCSEYGRLTQIATQGGGGLFSNIPLGHRTETRVELERRGLIPPSELPEIDASEITYGMTECEVRAAWVLPNQFATTASVFTKASIGTITTRFGLLIWRTVRLSGLALPRNSASSRANSAVRQVNVYSAP